jgi:hypothetical protein
MEARTMRVMGHNSWQHIWDCICVELGIEEF